MYAMSRIEFRRDELSHPTSGATAELIGVMTTAGAEAIVVGQRAGAVRAVKARRTRSNLVGQQGRIRFWNHFARRRGRFRFRSDLVWQQGRIGFRDRVVRRRCRLWFWGRRASGIEQHHGADE
jgi:hypothetical protein